MYFQIYNKTTGQTVATCPTKDHAKQMLWLMDDPDLEIRPIMKSEHPLARK